MVKGNRNYSEFMGQGIELPFDSQAGSIGEFVKELLNWAKQRKHDGSDELGVFNALFWKIVSGTRNAEQVKNDFNAAISELSSLKAGLRLTRSFSEGAYSADVKLLKKISVLIDAFSDSANKYDEQFKEVRAEFSWKDPMQFTEQESFYHNTGTVVEIIAKGLNTMKLSAISLEKAFEQQYKTGGALEK